MEQGTLKAIILAAGVGERMRPLTDHTPKPLLRVAGMPLIEHHILHLVSAGITELVINVSHLAQQIVDYCGCGERWGASITYSPEDEPLETAGGIYQAMPLLGNAPFMVVNGDIWIDYPFAQLATYLMRPDETAHLVMVDNPPQHPQGDFKLDDEGLVRVLEHGSTGLTYAGVGIYTPAFFAGMAPGKLPLRPLLDAAISNSSLGARYFAGHWADVGTPGRLQALDEQVKSAR
jgi:MurNAc alpha-1-phosphate uridylyltransferase